MIVLDQLLNLVLTSTGEVAAFLDHRGRTAGVLGRLVVPDAHLSDLARTVPAGDDLPVTVTTSSGAGGLVALARRHVPGVEVVAAVSTLRDLDDLAGNAARVVAAVAELPDRVRVFVGLPTYEPGRASGWLAAVEVVEAAGLSARIAWGGSSVGATEQLSALIEADLPFTVSGVLPGALLPLLRTVQALVEGADPTELFGQDLFGQDSAQHARIVAGWDTTTQQRVRRRLVECDSTQALALVDELVHHGLVAPLPR